jgi:hypothetical protein
MGIKRTAQITIKIKRISVRIFCSWNYTIYLQKKRKVESEKRETGEESKYKKKGGHQASDVPPSSNLK